VFDTNYCHFFDIETGKKIWWKHIEYHINFMV
jgi:hypothetical protein